MLIFPIGGMLLILLVVLFLLFTVGAIRAVMSGQKKNVRNAMLYFLATIILALSLVEFGSMATFVSDTNIPLVEVTGGPVRAALTWINLLFITAIWLLLGWRFLAKGRAKPDNRNLT